VREITLYSPSPQPSPLSACGHLPAAPTAQVDAQAGMKGEGVFLTFYEFINFDRVEKIVTAQYLGAMTMDSRLRGNDEIGQPPVIPAPASTGVNLSPRKRGAGIQYGCINNDGLVKSLLSLSFRVKREIFKT